MMQNTVKSHELLTIILGTHSCHDLCTDLTYFFLFYFPCFLFLPVSMAKSPKVYRMMLQFNYISATYIMTGKKKKKALHQKTKTLSGEFRAAVS